MNFFSILIIRSRNAPGKNADSGTHESGIHILWLTLEKDRAGTIMNRIISFPEQGPDAPETIGFLWQVFKEEIKERRPSCIFFDPDDCIPSAMTDALKKKFKTKFSDIPFICATDRHQREDLALGQSYKNGSVYNHLKAVPGISLIEFIPNTKLCALFLDTLHQMGFDRKNAQNRLGRLRVDKGLTRFWELGQHLEYHFKKPGDIPLELMNDIVEMVAAGGSVDTTHVRSNLKAAFLIGYTMENGVIVGDSSLKHPRQAFIDRLKKMTGLDFTGCVERGYTSVRPEYRNLGIGTRLLEGLTARASDHRIYSIIDEKNIAARKIALHNNTRKVAQYFSEKANKHLGVWMPDHMADQFLNAHKEDTDS